MVMGITKWCSPCQKFAYRDKVAGELAIERIRIKHGSERGSEPKRTYPCPYHNGWHLTSKAQRGKSKRGRGERRKR